MTSGRAPHSNPGYIYSSAEAATLNPNEMEVLRLNCQTTPPLAESDTLKPLGKYVLKLLISGQDVESGTYCHIHDILMSCVRSGGQLNLFDNVDKEFTIEPVLKPGASGGPDDSQADVAGGDQGVPYDWDNSVVDTINTILNSEGESEVVGLRITPKPRGQWAGTAFGGYQSVTLRNMVGEKPDWVRGEVERYEARSDRVHVLPAMEARFTCDVYGDLSGL